LRQSQFYSISFTVPVSHASMLRQVLGEAGAGKIGNYSHCSFSIRGIGRFCPLQNAAPFIGNKGSLEEVEEEKIETVCHNDLLDTVIDAIKRAHPYEEMVVDIYPVYDFAIKKSEQGER